jgi:uridine phosphorylase
LLVSSAAFGLDALAAFYRQSYSEEEKELLTQFAAAFDDEMMINPYIATANTTLLDKLANGIKQGITVTAPGFYSPQGRQVRACSAIPQLMDIVTNFRADDKRITNMEMETAGIYSLANILGHCAISFNVILANRAINEFSKQPAKIMDKYIKQLIEKISSNI